MKTIYILLMRSTTPLSRVVGLITSDKYTHTSIAFDESLDPLYSSTRKDGENMFPAGPCTEHLGRGYLGRHPFTPCALYELSVSDEAYNRARSEVLGFMEKADQYSFNIMGLIFCQIGRPLRRKNKYFCSQFVSEILVKSGALKLPREACLMKPSDYMRIPELRCCYEGTLGHLREQIAAAPRSGLSLAPA